MNTAFTSPSHTLQISSVKRIHGKAVLLLSNGTMLSMPRAMLKERPYKSGMAFDPVSFDTFLHERSYTYALEKSIRLLAARSRTEKEIELQLRQCSYPEVTIARVIACLQSAHYLNDSEFAANWTASRSAKGLGCRRIRMELQQKGVSQDEIDSALESLQESDIISSAVKAASKAARGKDLTSHNDRQKIIAALARRGFDFSVAKQALQLVIDEFE